MPHKDHNQDEINNFINDVLSESTFVSSALLSMFESLCNEYSVKLNQLAQSLKKIDTVIENENNATKAKLFFEPRQSTTPERTVNAVIKRKNWASKYAEGW